MQNLYHKEEQQKRYYFQPSVTIGYQCIVNFQANLYTTRPEGHQKYREGRRNSGIHTKLSTHCFF